MPQAHSLLLAFAVAALVGCGDASVESRPRMSEAEVLAIAEPAMASRFSESFEAHRPYHAKLNANMWRIHGTLPSGSIGGTPEAEVRDSDGELIRVYHTQ